AASATPRRPTPARSSRAAPTGRRAGPRSRSDLQALSFNLPPRGRPLIGGRPHLFACGSRANEWARRVVSGSASMVCSAPAGGGDLARDAAGDGAGVVGQVEL